MESGTTPPATPPAGWYDDPNYPDYLRWWDGSQWTEHTHPKAAQAAGAEAGGAPAGTAAAAGTGAAAGTAATPGTAATTPATTAAGEPAKGRRRGLDIARVIAIVLVIAAVAATIYLLTSEDDDDEPVPTPIPQEQPQAPEVAPEEQPPGEGSVGERPLAGEIRVVLRA